MLVLLKMVEKLETKKPVRYEYPRLKAPPHTSKSCGNATYQKDCEIRGETDDMERTIIVYDNEN